MREHRGICVRRDRWGMRSGPKSAVWFSSGACGLLEDGAQGLSQRGLIDRGQPAKFFEYEGWLDGGEDRFEDGRFEQACLSPSLHLHFTHGQLSGLLARDGHDQKVWVCPMVGCATDDNSGAAFHGGLICEGKGDEDEIPEFITGHSRRRRNYPRLG